MVICAALVALALTQAGGQASRVSLLEALQSEISTLVARTRAAVVTVYDEPAAGLNAGLPNAPADGATPDKERIAPPPAPEPAVPGGEAPGGPATPTPSPAAPPDSSPRALRFHRRFVAQAKQDKPFFSGRPADTTAPQPMYGWMPKAGTGFSIGDGFVVTTSDVVTGMEHPVVVTDDGARLRARVVGIDTDLNVGILRVYAKTSLPALTLGDSASVVAGNFAISIGNESGAANSVALNLIGSVRAGGVYSQGHFYPELIQIAGTVGAGSSGAPLVNARGEVIGILVAAPAGPWPGDRPVYRDFGAPVKHFDSGRPPYRAVPAPDSGGRDHAPGLGTRPLTVGRAVAPELAPTSVVAAGAIGGDPRAAVPPAAGIAPGVPAAPGSTPGGYYGVVPADSPLKFADGQFAFFHAPVTSAGYAVPINDLKEVIQDLREHNMVARGWIGIQPRDTAVLVSDNEGSMTVLRSVVVQDVFPGSPACAAGVQPGDILLEVNGSRVETSAQLRISSMRIHAGDTLHLTLHRGAAVVQCALKVAPRPDGRPKPGSKGTPSQP